MSSNCPDKFLHIEYVSMIILFLTSTTLLTYLPSQRISLMVADNHCALLASLFLSTYTLNINVKLHFKCHPRQIETVLRHQQGFVLFVMELYKNTTAISCWMSWRGRWPQEKQQDFQRVLEIISKNNQKVKRYRAAKQTETQSLQFQLCNFTVTRDCLDVIISRL